MEYKDMTFCPFYRSCAEELAKTLFPRIFGCGIHEDQYAEGIRQTTETLESAFAAQRQAGREEAAKDLFEAQQALIAEGMRADTIGKRYAALVEAAREIYKTLEFVCRMHGGCPFPCGNRECEYCRWYKLESALRKALSDLEA